MKAQELIIGHLLPITLAIAVLWIAYRLLFSNSNRLKFNRVFLLSSILFALALPLISPSIEIAPQKMEPIKENTYGAILLKEIVVTSDGQPVLPEVTVTTTTPSRFSVWQVIGGIYLIGVGVMTLLFLFKLGKLVMLIIRSPKRKMKGYTAVFTGHEHGSFSFFRYAFFPNENVDAEITRHEMSHIEHHHSWDILFAEVMMILQWFNPFIYLYKKELQSLHEYQADRDVVATGVDKKNYMMLILQQCTAVDFSGMSNNFSLILTKKRIKMITRNEKAKGLWWRLLATLPVLALLLIANTKVSAQKMKSEKGDTTPETEIRSEANGELTANNLTSSEDLYVEITKHDNDSVYNIVEEMPQFPGGEKALMDFVANNVKYPEEAKDNNISGRVFVGFVIEKDGSVNEVKILRGIGGGCDEEAVRVIKAMPKWKPGKQKGKPVRVHYTMPFMFKLQGDTPAKEKSKTK